MTPNRSKRKKVDWLPKQYTAIDFMKVTRQLFGMSLVETKSLYDYLLEQSKRNCKSIECKCYENAWGTVTRFCPVHKEEL